MIFLMLFLWLLQQVNGQLRVQTLPEEWPDDDQGDPTGLPMEIIFAEQSTSE